MDLDDFLNMEDESAQRWEDSLTEHHCPKCKSIMIELQSKKHGTYYRCQKCKKNFKHITLIYENNRH
jgi:tRNA(Ile2) C34 agmatinyltransferase TiaS